MSLEKNTIKNLTYRGHTLIINKIPNKIYKGITIIDSKEWTRESSLVEYVIDWFKSKINNLYKNMTYEDWIKAWGSNYKKVVYKNHILWITAIKRKDNKVFYIGVFYYHLEPDSKFYSKVTSFESINYDKIISRFERFVDEYCTDWQPRATFKYKDYLVKIDKEKDKEFYLGTVQFHKNSIYKYLADTREEVERCCINRISKVIYEKEKVKKGSKMINSREEKINQIQEQIDKLQQELEKIKNEKEIYIYKDIALEIKIDKSFGVQNWYIGKIMKAPKLVPPFYSNSKEGIKFLFEKYIDGIEKSTNIYLELTEQEIYLPEKHDY